MVVAAQPDRHEWIQTAVEQVEDGGKRFGVNAECEMDLDSDLAWQLPPRPADSVGHGELAPVRQPRTGLLDRA